MSPATHHIVVHPDGNYELWIGIIFAAMLMALALIYVWHVRRVQKIYDEHNRKVAEMYRGRR